MVHRVTTSDNEWQRVTTSGTTSDNERQRVTTSGITSHNEWQQWQRMATSDEWQRMTTSGTTSDNGWQRVTTSGTTSGKEWKWVTKSDSEWQWWQQVRAAVQTMKTAQYTSKNGWLPSFLWQKEIHYYFKGSMAAIRLSWSFYRKVISKQWY